MLDELLRMFNVISLIDGIRRGGRGVLITWILGNHTGLEVESFLRAGGVRVLDRKLGTKTDSEVGVWVSAKQSKYADGILRGAGFAITSAPLSKPIVLNHRWGKPAKAVGVGGMIGDVFGVGALAGRLAESNARPRREQRRSRKERY